MKPSHFRIDKQCRGVKVCCTCAHINLGLCCDKHDFLVKGDALAWGVCNDWEDNKGEKK